MPRTISDSRAVPTTSMGDKFAAYYSVLTGVTFTLRHNRRAQTDRSQPLSKSSGRERPLRTTSIYVSDIWPPDVEGGGGPRWPPGADWSGDIAPRPPDAKAQGGHVRRPPEPAASLPLLRARCSSRPPCRQLYWLIRRATSSGGILTNRSILSPSAVRTTSCRWWYRTKCLRNAVSDGTWALHRRPPIICPHSRGKDI